MQLSVNTYWTAPDGKIFRVLEIGEGADPWVHYQNIRTGEDYTCKAAAFQDRFKRIEYDTRT